MKTLFTLLLCLLALTTKADKYFSVSGGGSGSDWSSPATFSIGALAARGTTNWLADGSYGSVTFNQALSGSTHAIIKKATVATHGTSTGWSDTMGDGQGNFGWFTIHTGYLILDGSKRNESNWKDGASYGFRITKLTASIFDSDAAHFSVFAHVDMGGTYSDTYYSGMKEALYLHTQHDITVSRCFLHNGLPAIAQLAGTYNFTNEYSWWGPGWGKEAIRGGNNNPSHDWVIRYNKFWNSSQTDPDDGSSGITAEIGIWDYSTANGLDNIAVYGNWFFNQYSGGRNAIIVIGGNGSSWAGTSSANSKVYNNTFAGIADDGAFGAVLINGSTGEAKNNLFYNCAGGANATAISATTVANNVSNASNPFVSYSGLDWRITGDIAGASLSSPFNIDPLGVTRGSDGTFDVGAFEYDSGNTNGPGLINSATTASGTNGIAFTYQITTTSNTATVFGLGGTTLPTGLSLNTASGLISGTPTLVGATNISLTASNAYGGDDEILALEIYAGDTLAPTNTLTAPTNGQAVSGTLTITATADDNIGVTAVRFYIGTTLVNEDPVVNYSYDWDSSTVVNGSYTVSALALDAAGNSTWSATNTITVSNATPVIPEAASYWPMNENTGTTTADSISTNTLTLTNGAAWAPGKYNSGIAFDGTNDFLVAPNSATLDIATNRMTAMLWVNPTNQGTWFQLVSKVKEFGAFTSPYFSWHLYGGTGDDSDHWRPNFQVVNAGGLSVYVGATNTPAYGTWTHVAGVYDGTNMILYVNGEVSGVTVQSGNLMSYDAPLLVGAHGLPGEYTKGVVDDVRLYSQAFTQAEIREIYNQSAIRTHWHITTLIK